MSVFLDKNRDMNCIHTICIFVSRISKNICRFLVNGTTEDFTAEYQVLSRNCEKRITTVKQTCNQISEGNASFLETILMQEEVRSISPL